MHFRKIIYKKTFYQFPLPPASVKISLSLYLLFIFFKPFPLTLVCLLALQPCISHAHFLRYYSFPLGLNPSRNPHYWAMSLARALSISEYDVGEGKADNSKPQWLMPAETHLIIKASSVPIENSLPSPKEVPKIRMVGLEKECLSLHSSTDLLRLFNINPFTGPFSTDLSPNPKSFLILSSHLIQKLAFLMCSCWLDSCEDKSSVPCDALLLQFLLTFI